MTRTCKLALFPVLLFQLCLFLPVALHRLVDADEGYYLLASRLVLMHRTPYFDFFYPQAPLLPYAYAFLMKMTGVSWSSVRLFSGCLTAILGVVLYQHVCRETRNCLAGLAAVALFSSSTLVIAWYPLVKTFSLAGLFLFCAYALISRISAAPSPWLLASAGVLFGLSVDTRSYVVVLVPIFLWWILDQSAANRMVSSLWFFLGFGLGITPSLYLFLRSPDIYMFNNLGYHAIRSHAGLVGDWRAKLNTVRLLLTGPDNNGLQFSLVAAVSVIFVGLRRARRDSANSSTPLESPETRISARDTGSRSTRLESRETMMSPRDSSWLAFLIALALGCISILPSPALVQYFCLCVPFLIAAAVCSAAAFLAEMKSLAFRRGLAAALGVALVGFIAAGVPGFQNYLVTGNYVLGIRGPADAPNWTLQRMNAVSQAVDQLAVPGEEIGSFWSGYLFQPKAVPYAGFEDEWGRAIASKLTPEQRAKYHIVSDTEIEADFAAHLPRLVVLGNQEILWVSPQVAATARILAADGYTLARKIGNTFIYVWSPPS